MDFQDSDFKIRVAELTGQAVATVEFPGGKTRDTVRLILADGRPIIATSRKNAVRSTRELQLLYALAAAQVPAPRVLGVEEGYFLQSSVGGTRLSEILNDSDDVGEKESRLAEALAGLRAAQTALAGTSVGQSLELTGAGRDAALYRAGFPMRIAQRLGLPVPEYDLNAVADLIACRDDAPIKLDARPANALLGPEGRLVWIDWDRAGRRNLADDPVSLLFDEYTAIPDATRANLIARHGGDFSGTRPDHDMTDYIYSAGIAQCCFRIDLILSQLEKHGRWADPEICLRKDRIGSSPDHMIRLCDIALHAVENAPVLAPCAPVFETLRERVQTRPADRLGGA